MLEIQKLTSRYGRIEVLHDVSLSVSPNEIVALIGSNGAGKTTLLRAISGVQPTAGGTIAFEGAVIGAVAPYRRAGMGIAHVPQGRQVFANLTVEDNLTLGAWSQTGKSVVADMEQMYQLFPILSEFRKRSAGSLSGGQQQMLAIGRALMSRPKILLLDEPSMGLAPLLIEQVFEILKKIRSIGMTILVVEQNVRAVLEVADRGYVLETGSITHDGMASTLLNDPRIQQAYFGV
ncbi:ABC transporter ATP-binding protein [Variovorax sp. V118]|uniref:ABC transporter ATP-binding protein n=1 Tax=Variovorax sp. V118 TaxID=3065954 RepID=UPI0034E8ADF9